MDSKLRAYLEATLTLVEDGTADLDDVAPAALLMLRTAAQRNGWTPERLVSRISSTFFLTTNQDGGWMTEDEVGAMIDGVIRELAGADDPV